MLTQELLNKALKGYEKYKNHKKVKKHNCMIIIDYTQHSSRRRLFVVNLHTKKVVRMHHVAHGVNTASDVDPGYAVRFSNRVMSKCSNIGYLVTGGTYYGKYGKSLNIHGLEPGKNNNCFRRRVVFHKSKYVTDRYIAWRGMAGLSWGCPAMDPAIFDSFRDLVAGGTFCYFHGQDNTDA